MGEGVGAPDIRGQEGYRRWKRKGQEVGEIGENFLQQANILQVKRGGNQECTVPEVRG